MMHGRIWIVGGALSSDKRVKFLHHEQQKIKFALAILKMNENMFFDEKFSYLNVSLPWICSELYAEMFA